MYTNLFIVDHLKDNCSLTAGNVFNSDTITSPTQQTGAGSPLMQLTISMSSHRLHPCQVGEGTCGRLRRQITAWYMALSQCLRKVSTHGGIWLESRSLFLAQKTWQVNDIYCSRILAVHEAGELLKT